MRAEPRADVVRVRDIHLAAKNAVVEGKSAAQDKPSLIITTIRAVPVQVESPAGRNTAAALGVINSSRLGADWRCFMAANPELQAGARATHPLPPHATRDPLFECIDACFATAPVCIRCADACLADTEVTRLRRCINLCLICSDICLTTGRALCRLTATADVTARSQMLQACELTCQACAEECEKHPQLEHCRICAEACRRCERSCR